MLFPLYALLSLLQSVPSSLPKLPAHRLVFSLTVNASPDVSYKQQPLVSAFRIPGVIDHPLYPPRINYAGLDPDDDGLTPPPSGMVLHPIHVSGSSDERIDLTFFADGCKFRLDSSGQS